MPTKNRYDSSVSDADYASGETDQERRRRLAELERRVGDQQIASKLADQYSQLSPEEFDSAINTGIQSSGAGTRLAQNPSKAMGRPQNTKSATFIPSGVPSQQVQQQSRQQQDIGRQMGERAPMSNQGSLYDEGTTRHRVIGEQDDPGQWGSAFGTGWSSGRKTQLSNEEAKLEFRMLEGEADSFAAMRQQLTQNYERMDPVARSHYAQMQKQIMGLEKARSDGRLRPLEYLRGVKNLSEQAKQIKWQYHFKAPGGEPGDVVVTDGVMKMRKKDGDLEAVGYTPDFVQNNIVRLPGGKIAVPTSPGKPHEIIEEGAWDKDSMSAHKQEFQKHFKDQWKNTMKELTEMNGRPPTVREMADAEESVRAQVIAMMDGANRGAEELMSRQRRRLEGESRGVKVDMQDPMEEYAQKQRDQLSEQFKVPQAAPPPPPEQPAAPSPEQFQQNAAAAQAPAKPRPVSESDILRRLDPNIAAVPAIRDLAMQMSKIRAASGGVMQPGSPGEAEYRKLALQLKQMLEEANTRKSKIRGR